MANGKGSGRRPAAVGDSHIETEWRRIFGPVESDLVKFTRDYLGVEMTPAQKEHIFSPESLCPGCHHCQPANLARQDETT